MSSRMPPKRIWVSPSAPGCPKWDLGAPIWVLRASIGFRVPPGGIWVPPLATGCPKWDLGATNGFGCPWVGSDCP